MPLTGFPFALPGSGGAHLSVPRTLGERGEAVNVRWEGKGEKGKGKKGRREEGKKGRGLDGLLGRAAALYTCANDLSFLSPFPT